MKIGVKLQSPEGWHSIPTGIDVHFLKNNYQKGRVLFVHFKIEEKGMAKALLISLPKHKFEEGLSFNKIVPCSVQPTLPPWLSEMEGLDLTQIDTYRTVNAKKSHHERVNDRFLHIATAVNNFETIMNADDPQKEINKHARLCTPVQNESRFSLWLLTYLCFGRNIWTLLPPFHKIGHWDRMLHPETKLGAPSKAFGKSYGHGMNPELAKQCIKSYFKRATLGKYMVTIYQEAMSYDFSCHYITQKNGMKIFVSADGLPFPTYDQFRYQIHKEIGKERVQKQLYGEVRYRTRIASSKGRFSEEVANLMERVEADAYYLSEKPVGFIDKTTLPPLCIVTGRDVLSGSMLGIGFSFGKERSTAYRMMLFSMAVSKVYFCQLFGIQISPDEWMNEGLPGHFGIDRGPGARKDLIAAIEERFPIGDMAPSWSGQSKATVESSHPRDVKIEGQPIYVNSNLNPVELARREIMRLITFNNSANMEDRIDPQSELAHVVPSPNGLWSFYDQLYRNDAQPISKEDAIRCFLTPIVLNVREDGVYIKSRKYYSEELRDAGLLDTPGMTKVQGYILDMAVRYVWVEFKGRLIETPAMLKMRGDDESLYISTAELEQWDEQRSKTLSAFRLHQQATKTDMMHRYKSSTGKEFNPGKQFSGKPSKSGTSIIETSEVLHSASRELESKKR